LNRCQLRFNVLLFIILFGLFPGVDVQAGGSIESAGDVLMIILPASAAGLTLFFKDGQGTLQLGESAALALGVTFGLKSIIDEQRPNGEPRSFPSGHASISFASAEFMRIRYGWKYGLPAYLLASFVAYSRVESNQHYTHDVMAGAAIGILSSTLFTRPYEGWNIQAEADHNYFGIRFSRTW
jgi:membrane-associated phospholipid phosphatase